MLVHYGSSEKEADAVVAVIREAGGKAEKVGADLRKPEGPHALARQVRAIVGFLPPTLRYEPGVIAASGDYVIVHGRVSGNGRPRACIAADVCRIADGVLAEHWDVLEDEATKAVAKSGSPMFGKQFAD